MARPQPVLAAARVPATPKAIGHAAAFAVLTGMFLAAARREWRTQLVVSTAMPAGIVLLLGSVAHLGSATGRTATVGAMVLVLAITAVALLAQRVSAAVHNGSFDLLRTLPVAPVVVLFAFFVSATAFAVPGLVVVAAVGHLLYGGMLDADVGALPVVILGGLAMGGIGVWIGMATASEALAGLIGNLAMMGFLFLAIIPSAHMAGAVRVVRDLLPVGPAADGLGSALGGHGVSVWEVAVLAAWAVAGAWAGSVKAIRIAPGRR